MSEDVQTTGEIILFRSDDGQTKVQVKFHDKSVWLPQRSIAELFQVSVKTANEHLINIYEEGELQPEATIRKFRIVQTEGKREVTREIDHYNLEAILAVGYRVRSSRGTQFRQWATKQLQEFLLKGFVMDDERLKKGESETYFDELIARIRDIRSSERIFWRKILDIYSTSVDYDANSESSKQFFATIQNKMHWAAHGKTAAEVVVDRANAEHPNMGLITWTGLHPKKSDVGIAKIYLAQEELTTLNLIVSAYLDFAELQAIGRKIMHMKDWLEKLDSFLKLSERDILSHSGKVSHDKALKKAELEYDKFRSKQDPPPTKIDQDFEMAMGTVKEITKTAKPKRQKKN